VSPVWIAAICVLPFVAGALVAALIGLIYTAVTYGIWVIDRREAGEIPPHWNVADLARFASIFFDEHFAASSLFFLHPLGAIDPAPPKKRERDGRRPILLVPGYTQVQSNMWLLSARLWAEGLGPIYTINLKPWDASILDHAAKLSAFIDELMLATGSEQIDIVAHSMGGIVARVAEAGRLSPRVRRLVTIGTPHRGSRVAELATGRGGIELRMQSEVLRALPPPPPGMIVAISSSHDNVVVPPENARIGTGGRDVIVEGVGHLAMLVDPKIAEEVAKALGEDVRTAEKVLVPLPRKHAVIGAVRA
jgi:triacylglycerol lipase